MEIDHHLTEL